jgi:predicted esterase
LLFRFGRLPHKARNVAKFIYIDAPYLLELRGGDDVPMRTWFYREGDRIVDETLETSLTLLEEVWHRDGPFVGIFGFSMGGSLASILATLPLRFPGLEFVIVGGAPDVPSHLLDPAGNSKIPSAVKSLHLVGLADNVIPHHVSKKLATRFTNARVIEHEQGHCIPTRAAMLNTYVEFLEEMQGGWSTASATDANKASKSSIPFPLPTPPTACAVLAPAPSEQRALVASEAIAVLQSEEMEVLSSIFTPEEISLLGDLPTAAGQPTASCRVLLSPGYGAEDAPAVWTGNLGITFTLHSAYPEAAGCPPSIEVHTGSLSLLNFPLAYRRDLLTTVRATAAEICQDAGETCLLQCVQAANDWLGEAKWANVPRYGAVSSVSSGASANAKVDASSTVPVGGKGCKSKGAGGVEADAEALRRATEAEEEEAARLEEEWVKQATLEAGRAAALAKKMGVGTSGTAGTTVCASVTEMDTSSVYVSASARGIWEYTVGLVGKPSAGKVKNKCT